MSYGHEPHTSSSGTILAIVVAVGLLLLGGILVLGLAGLFLFRSTAAPAVRFPEPQPRVVEERAVLVEPKRDVASTADGQAQGAVELSPTAAAVRKMTIRLDPQGKILADGQSVDLDGLKTHLAKARDDGPVRLEVLVAVDPQCLFEHVAAVQSVCEQVGITSVQILASNRTPD